MTVSECASHAVRTRWAVRLQGRRGAVAGPEVVPAAGGGLAADRGPELLQLAGLVHCGGHRGALLWRVKSDLSLQPLEFLTDGSYLSVLVNPKVKGAARQKLIDAARAGQDLDPAKARYVRVVEYEVPDRAGDGKDELIALVTTITDLRQAPPPLSRPPIRKDGSTKPGTRSSRRISAARARSCARRPRR